MTESNLIFFRINILGSPRNSYSMGKVHWLPLPWRRKFMNILKFSCMPSLGITDQSQNELSKVCVFLHGIIPTFWNSLFFSELKIRMSVYLQSRSEYDLQNTFIIPSSAPLFQCGFFFLELHPRLWREALPYAVNVINNHQQVKPYRGINAILYQFFTQTKNEPINLPQSHPRFFKFNIDQNVLIDLTKKQRKDLKYKFSLMPGSMTIPLSHDKPLGPFLWSRCAPICWWSFFHMHHKQNITLCHDLWCLH